MATKIKETPILEGRAARRFLKIIRGNRDKMVSKSSFKRAKNSYKYFKVIDEENTEKKD